MDTNAEDMDISSFINMGKDGYNLAIIFNASPVGNDLECPGGILCLAEDIGGMFTEGFERALMMEMKTFEQVLF